jgi:hypothetical protein
MILFLHSLFGLNFSPLKVNCQEIFRSPLGLNFSPLGLNFSPFAAALNKDRARGTQEHMELEEHRGAACG